MVMTDKEWEEFKKWCKDQYPMWTPDRITLDMYFKWESEQGK